MAQSSAGLPAALATPPDYFNLLPSEILTIIFKLTENPSSVYNRRRDDKRKQAFVCRRWYHLRVEREIFHITSLKQLKALIRVLKVKKGEKGKLVKELYINLKYEKPKGKLEAITSIIELCPGLKKFNAEVRGTEYMEDGDFEVDALIWGYLRKLDLIEFRCNVMRGVELTKTLVHWPNFKKLHLELQSFYYDSPTAESIEEDSPLPHNIDSFSEELAELEIEIDSKEDVLFLATLLKTSRLQKLVLIYRDSTILEAMNILSTQVSTLQDLTILRAGWRADRVDLGSFLSDYVELKRLDIDILDFDNFHFTDNLLNLEALIVKNRNYCTDVKAEFELRCRAATFPTRNIAITLYVAHARPRDGDDFEWEYLTRNYVIQIAGNRVPISVEWVYNPRIL